MGADLNRRTVVPGKIGVEGRAPKIAKDLALRIGLPHKKSWTVGLQPTPSGGVALSDAVLTPLETFSDVVAVIADLSKLGLGQDKKSDLETYLIKQIRSPNGMVVAARSKGMRNTTAVMSLFREVEVDLESAVSYHVHAEELIDLFPNAGASQALLDAYARQAEADLAVLAHRLAALGVDAKVDILCESNNDDTHDAAEALSNMTERALLRIAENSKFAAATAGVQFEVPTAYCF